MVPFIPTPERPGFHGWRIASCSIVVAEADIFLLADKARKCKPAKVNSYYLGQPTEISVVRIEVDRRELVVNTKTGQLFDPVSGACLSSPLMSIKPL